MRSQHFRAFVFMCASMAGVSSSAFAQSTVIRTDQGLDVCFTASPLGGTGQGAEITQATTGFGSTVPVYTTTSTGCNTGVSTSNLLIGNQLTGNGSTPLLNQIALGNNAGQNVTASNTIAMGNTANASGDGGIAIGANSQSLGAGSIAFGAGASVSTANSLALGANSVAARGAQTGYTAFGLSSPQNSSGEVSVGSSGNARQITNVAAGSAATDAVNVSQLQGAASNLGTSVASALGGGASYNSATGQVTAPSYTVGGSTFNNVAGAINALDGAVSSISAGLIPNFHANTSLPDSQATGNNAVAIGPQSIASGDNSFAAGNGAQATGTNAIAIGTGAVATGSLAIGANANAGTGGTALGDDTKATGMNSAALGTGAEATQANATAIGTGTKTTRANQISVGTASNQYTFAGITSGASKAFQTGPLEVVTTDANGNLASDGGSIFRRLDNLVKRDRDLADGIAIATSLANPDLVAGERFGMTVNFGNWDGASAIGIAAQGVVGYNAFAQGDRVAISGGVGFGSERGTVAGRVGVQWTR